MTTVDTVTGEILSVTADHAKRWAERARLDLEASADRGEAGLSKIRTAISERHDASLGYRSLSDYLNAEYADALGNVCRVFGVEFRRQVVGDLEEAGLSTRAIASVVGTSQQVVHNDIKVTNRLSPEPDEDPACANCGKQHDPGCTYCGLACGDCECDREFSFLPAVEDETPSATGAPPAEVEEPGEAGAPFPPARPAVTIGIDGKTYTRKPSAPKAPPRRALTDQFFDAAYDMGKAIERVSRLTKDDRFPHNAEKVAAKHRNDLIRSRDLLQQVIDRLA